MYLFNDDVCIDVKKIKIIENRNYEKWFFKYRFYKKKKIMHDKSCYCKNFIVCGTFSIKIEVKNSKIKIIIRAWKKSQSIRITIYLVQNIRIMHVF